MRTQLLLLLSLSASSFASAGEWRQFLDEDGVRGYAREVDGSDILELRSTIVVPAKMEVVGAVLRDVEGLARPGTSCTEARFVERRDHNSYIFYLAYDFPWPLSDRDVVIRATTRYHVDKGRVISDLQAIEDPRVPPREGYIRIEDMTSQFVIEYLSREQTGVVFTTRVDPGGRLPSFLINVSSKGSLKENALDLRRAARAPEYVERAAASSDTQLVERITRDPAEMKKISGNRLGEIIGDRRLVDRLLADQRVFTELTSGSGEIGATIMHGWGSRQSRAQAVRLLLTRYLRNHTDDRAAIERFVSDPKLIERILARREVDAAVAAFISRHKREGT
jgi:hypothetical protein